MAMMAAFTGCQKTAEQTPENQAQAYLAAVLKEDTKAAEKAGMEETEYVSVQQKMAESFMNRMRESRLGCVLLDPDAHQEEFYSHVQKGLSKLGYETRLVSENEKEAVVEVKIGSFAMDQIIQGGQERMGEKRGENPGMTIDETIDALYESVGEEFEMGTEESDQTGTIRINFVRNGNRWVMEDNLESELCEAVLPL